MRLRALEWRVATASPEVSAESVRERFDSEPDLPGVVVLMGQGRVSLLSRSRLGSVMSAPYVRALFAHKPVSALLTYLGDEPLLLADSTSVEDAVEAAMGRPAEVRFDPVLVHSMAMAVPAMVEVPTLLFAQCRALREAREDAESAARARTSLFASVSEELRTPLTAIIGYGDLVHHGHCGKTELQTHGRTIAQRARGLLGVVNDVLDQARLASGRMLNEPRPTQLSGLIEEAISARTSDLSGRPVSLRAYLHESWPATVAVDAARLRQVLAQLLGNALKFTERGRVVVDAHFLAEDGIEQDVEQEGSGWVRLLVSDTGEGMDAAGMARCLEAFERTSTRGGGRGGSGLGLSIASGLCGVMGGRLRLCSQAGVGTTVAVDVPISWSAETPWESPGPVGSVLGRGGGWEKTSYRFDPASMRPAPSPVLAAKRDVAASEQPGVISHPGQLADGPCVLLVEDAPDFQRLLVALLGPVSRRIDVVARGEDAVPGGVAASEPGPGRSESADVVVLDYQLPGIDGLEVARQRHAAGWSVPTLMLTAQTDGSFAVEALALGCREVLGKPIDRAELVRAVRDAAACGVGTGAGAMKRSA